MNNKIGPQSLAAGIIAAQGDCRLVGPVPVAFHHLWPGNAQFALLANGHFLQTGFEINDFDVRVREWQTNTARFSFTQRRCRVGDRRGFG